MSICVHLWLDTDAVNGCEKLMSANEWILERDGFCLLNHAVDAVMIQRLLTVFEDTFEDDSQSVRAR